MRTHDQERGGWRHKRDMDRCVSCHISTDNIVCTASSVLYVRIEDINIIVTGLITREGGGRERLSDNTSDRPAWCHKISRRPHTTTCTFCVYTTSEC